MRVPYWLLLLFVAIGVLTAAAPRPAHAEADVQAVVACSTNAPQVSFVVRSSDAAGVTDVGAASSVPAALDAAQPLVAVTCQAVLWHRQAPADAAFVLEPGVVSFTTTGPAEIVESDSAALSVACGSAGVSGSCNGAIMSPTSGLLSAMPAFTVHLALAPGAVLPELPAPDAIQLQVAFAGAVGAASAVTTVAISPTGVAVTLATDNAVIDSGVAAAAVITARLSHALPTGCSVIGGGPFAVCTGTAALIGFGAEAGTLTFSTSVGTFANGLPRIAAPCGEPQAAPLVVPAVGAAGPIAFSCTEVQAKLRPAGHAGDALIAVTFVGGLTHTTAGAELHINVVPAPPAVPLPVGCTDVQIPAGFPPDGAADLLVDSISPSSAVTAIWVRSPDTGAWQAAYLRDAAAPADDIPLTASEGIVVCADAPVQFPVS